MSFYRERVKDLNKPLFKDNFSVSLMVNAASHNSLLFLREVVIIHKSIASPRYTELLAV